MKNEFITAITLLAAEKNLPKEVVFDAVEVALASAYKKDNLAQSNVVVKINPDDGSMRVYTTRAVVEELVDDHIEMSLEEARRMRIDAKIGDVFEFEATPANAGRIAAQTAKQVVLQRLREAEREVVYEEYAGKEGDIVSGVVQRMEGRNAIIDLGKTEAVLPPPEQVRTEHYRPTQRLKVLPAGSVQGGEGAAGRRLADAQGSAQAAVRAGGARDLQGHRRDQVDRARGGLPVEGGGVLAAGGRRPGGRLRRHARHSHPERCQ